MAINSITCDTVRVDADNDGVTINDTLWLTHEQVSSMFEALGYLGYNMTGYTRSDDEETTE